MVGVVGDVRDHNPTPESDLGVCRVAERYTEGDFFLWSDARDAIMEVLGRSEEQAEFALTRLRQKGGIYPLSTRDDEERHRVLEGEGIPDL